MNWQQAVVDVVVLGAAAWLVWSFGPESLRRRLRPRRPAAPSYDVALQADGLAGQEEGGPSKACGPDCGCGG